MPFKPEEREYRQKLYEGNINTEENYVVEGYALTFDRYKLYEVDGVEYYERFERNAFDETDMSDIIMKYDHEGMVLARTKNNTLEVNVDDIGLHIKADLSKTTKAREVYEAISNKMVDKMSWAFPNSSQYRFDKSTRTIVWEKITKIYDVSAVGIPANPGTSIYARSIVEGVIEQDLKEFQERECERKKEIEKYKYFRKVSTK